MKIDRVKNTKRNIVWGIINRLTLIFFPFLIRTIIIRILGDQYSGLNGLFTSILQVLNLTELGVSNVIIYSMYQPIADNDHGEICALLKLFKRVYLIIGIVILFLGVVLAPFLPYFIKDDIYTVGINIQMLYLIYLLNTSISYFVLGYKSAILSAFHRSDIMSKNSTIVECIMYIVQIIMLIRYENYYIYIIFLPISTLLINLLNAYATQKMYPQYKCTGSVSKKIFKNIKTQTMGLMLNKFCQVSRNSLDNICISTFLGLTITTIYGNYYYILGAVISLISIFATSMLSGIGNSIATETRAKNYEDFKKFNFLYMWISGWCGICLLTLYQPFMQIWMGKEYMFSNKTVILFVTYFYALKMGDVRGLYSDAIGLWWQNRYRAIMETVSNLILNVLFVRLWGINGIILATILSLFFFNFISGSRIVFKYYFTDARVGEFYRIHLIYILVTIFVGTFMHIIMSAIDDIGIWSFLVKCIMCSIIPNILYLAIYLCNEEKRRYIKWAIDTLIRKNHNRLTK